MAEYYSAELSQKIRRGMEINAQKCLSNGSNPGLGFMVDQERHLDIEPAGAAVLREIFGRYAAGDTVADICKDLNDRKIKTSQGKEFNKNSLHRMLRNRRYIGWYIYGKTETPGGMPRIIEDELFERVQHILDRNKKAPARTRGREEYLLTTKLFCGYCREMMVGYGGNKPVTIVDIPFKEIEASNAEFKCSLVVADATAHGSFVHRISQRFQSIPADESSARPSLS